MQLTSVDEIIRQAMEVAARLDALSTRDDRATTLATLEWAQQEYAALMRQRESLPSGDTALVDVLLDNVRARLKFFGNRS